MSILSSTRAGKEFLKITDKYLNEKGWRSMYGKKGKTYIHPDYLHIRLEVLHISGDEQLDLNVTVLAYKKTPRVSSESAGGLFWNPWKSEGLGPKITNIVDYDKVINELKSLSI